METKQKKLTKLLEMGYDVTFLCNLRIGDTFQTREDGVWYIVKNITSELFFDKYCYHRIDNFSSSFRYYYDFGDKIVFNRNRSRF